MKHSSPTHNADVTNASGPDRRSPGAPVSHPALPRVPRPRPRSPEPGLLARMLPGTDEPPAPAAVRAAFALWLTAAAAGVFAMVLTVVREASGGSDLDASTGGFIGGFTGGLLLRMALFSAVVLVAVRLLRGARWPRWALTGALGAFGALAAPTLAAWPDRWPTGTGVVLHLAAALTATALTFCPSANAWFRAAGHR